MYIHSWISSQLASAYSTAQKEFLLLSDPFSKGVGKSSEAIAPLINTFQKVSGRWRMVVARLLGACIYTRLHFFRVRSNLLKKNGKFPIWIENIFITTHSPFQIFFVQLSPRFQTTHLKLRSCMWTARISRIFNGPQGKGSTSMSACCLGEVLGMSQDRCTSQLILSMLS